jgi:hypothetical protein
MSNYVSTAQETVPKKAARPEQSGWAASIIFGKFGFHQSCRENYFSPIFQSDSEYAPDELYTVYLGLPQGNGLSNDMFIVF